MHRAFHASATADRRQVRRSRNTVTMRSQVPIADEGYMYIVNPLPPPGIRRRLRPSRPSSLADAKCLPVGPW